MRWFRKKGLETLFLELTSRCNAECTMCTHGFMKRPRGDMDLSLAESVIDQAKPDTVVLHFYGESTLYPYLIDVVDYATEARCKTVLDTNGELMTRSLFTELSKAGLSRLVFSFGAVSPQTHGAIWKGLHFETVACNVIDCHHAKKTLGLDTKLVVRGIISDANRGEAKAIESFWRKYCDKLVLIDVFHLYGDDRIPWEKRSKPDCKKRRRLYREMVVKHDGDVALCCNDLDGDYVLGNLEKQSFKEVWSGLTMKEARDRIYGRMNPPHICRECVIRPW